MFHFALLSSEARLIEHQFVTRPTNLCIMHRSCAVLARVNATDDRRNVKCDKLSQESNRQNLALYRLGTHVGRRNIGLSTEGPLMQAV